MLLCQSIELERSGKQKVQPDPFSVACRSLLPGKAADTQGEDVGEDSGFPLQ